MNKLIAKRKNGAKTTAQRVLRSIGDDIRAHKWRYAMVCVVHAWLLAVLFTQAELTLVTLVVGLAEVIMVALTVRMFGLAARHPGRLVHEWALQENQHQTITSLKGKTTEELETMLQYYMENGNIEAADRISQQLLHMVDGIAAVDEQPAPVVEVPKKNEDGSAIKISSGLPNWMQDGKTAAEDEQQQQSKSSSNLPDWMNN